MGDVIHLTAEQAAQISGPSTSVKDAIMTPAPLNDGTFILGPHFATRQQVEYSAISALVPQIVP